MTLEAGVGRVAAFLIGVLATVAAAAAGDDTPPVRGGVADAAPVLARFLARPDEPVARYRARRRMEVRAAGHQARMTARVELDPALGFRFSVLSEGGSQALREKSLVRLLRAEAEAHASGLVSRSGLTAENYVIEALGPDAGGLVRLRARARRREAALFDGFFVVTPDAADLVRVEGRLAQGPSFWIPRVDVVRHFARIGGHRVVVRSDSVAHVRLLGESRLRVDYEYEMIDGQEIVPATAVAALGPP